MILNTGLVQKSWRETRGATLTFGLCAMLVAVLIHFALPRFQKNIESFQLPAARLANLTNLRNAMLGTDVSNAGGREVSAGVAWSHPFFLALVFAHVITVWTRVPAAEVERGTMDVLLGLPVSRWQIFVSESVVCTVTSAAVVLMGVIGSRIGNGFVPAGMTPDLGLVLMVAVNLLLLDLAVGSCAAFFATLTDRRMRAVAAVLLVVVGSLLVNYLRLLWEPAKSISFLSLLEYYRPIGPLRDGTWPWGNMAVLGGVICVLWTAAGVWFARRDITTT